MYVYVYKAWEVPGVIGAKWTLGAETAAYIATVVLSVAAGASVSILSILNAEEKLGAVFSCCEGLLQRLRSFLASRGHRSKLLWICVYLTLYYSASACPLLLLFPARIAQMAALRDVTGWRQNCAERRRRGRKFLTQRGKRAGAKERH